MAAMALSSIRFQATARKNAAFFSPSGITATRALTPTLSLRERGLAVSRNQSLTAGEWTCRLALSAAEPNTASHAHYRRLSTRLIPSMA